MRLSNGRCTIRTRAKSKVMDAIKFIEERNRMCKSFISLECKGCPTCNYGSEYINEIDITLVPIRFILRQIKCMNMFFPKGR